MEEAPKTVVEKVQESFKALAETILDEFGEIDGLMLTVDWKTNRMENPCGFCVPRNKNLTAVQILNLIEQIKKMEVTLLRVLKQSIRDISDFAKRQEEEIQKKLDVSNADLTAASGPGERSGDSA